MMMVQNSDQTKIVLVVTRTFSTVQRYIKKKKCQALRRKNLHFSFIFGGCDLCERWFYFYECFFVTI